MHDIIEMSMEELFDAITQDVGDSTDYQYLTTTNNGYGLTITANRHPIASCPVHKRSREDAINALRGMIEEYAPIPVTENTGTGHSGEDTNGTLLPTFRRMIALQTRRGNGNTLVDNTFLMYVGTVSADNGFLVIKHSDGLYSIGTIPEGNLNRTSDYLFDISAYI